MFAQFPNVAMRHVDPKDSKAPAWTGAGRRRQVHAFRPSRHLGDGPRGPDTKPSKRRAKGGRSKFELLKESGLKNLSSSNSSNVGGSLRLRLRSNQGTNGSRGGQRQGRRLPGTERKRKVSEEAFKSQNRWPRVEGQ
jgi:hypothetical protein